MVELGKPQMTMEDEQTHGLNLLGADDYTNIGTLQRQGKRWTTTASKSGESLHLVVDPAAGTVKAG